MYDNSYEKDPSSAETKGEQVVIGDDFEKAFKEGVPDFAGEKHGIAHDGNEYIGEAEKPNNEGIINAASLTLYGILEAAIRDLNAKNGKRNIEDVIRVLEQFDPSNSENPLLDLYIRLGIDTKKEFDDAREESQASKSKAVMEKFRQEYNMPATQKKSREGFIKAIRDTKELIAEVKGADPRYQELRDAARSANKGVFEYIAGHYDSNSGLTEIFGFLAEQKEKKEQPEPEAQESPDPEQESKVTEFSKSDSDDLNE